MIFLSTRQHSYITQASSWLLSQGVQFRWEIGEVPGAWILEISEDDADRVAEFLSEMLREDQLPKRVPMGEWVPLLLQPPFAFAFCFAVVFVNRPNWRVAPCDWGCCSVFDYF